MVTFLGEFRILSKIIKIGGWSNILEGTDRFFPWRSSDFALISAILGNAICSFLWILQIVCLLGVYQKWKTYFWINFTFVTKVFSQLNSINLAHSSKHLKAWEKNDIFSNKNAQKCTENQNRRNSKPKFWMNARGRYLRDKFFRPWSYFLRFSWVNITHIHRDLTSRRLIFTCTNHVEMF